ncbi:MAG: NUDIX hydrolase [Candidatus Nanogingivalaceae bacterium]|nr:NUDIX hydrolase [Candidatus Nanogingivalaceae bacterium]
MTMSELKTIRAAYRVSVKGLIYDDNNGKLLFVRERSDTWDLPGGGLEHGEGMAEALRRECREELGAEIEITDAAPIIIPTWSKKFDIPVLIIAYRVRLVSPPTTTPDVSELRYIGADELGQVELDSTLSAMIDQFYI